MWRHGSFEQQVQLHQLRNGLKSSMVLPQRVSPGCAQAFVCLESSKLMLNQRANVTYCIVKGGFSRLKGLSVRTLDARENLPASNKAKITQDPLTCATTSLS
jgi:hypothetical protein